MSSGDYLIRVLQSPLALPRDDWNGLLARQQHPTPFMRHEYLAALHASGCAVPETGWTPRFITVWRAGDAPQLVAACPLYLKTHSYGEYVFDWAWAQAYADHGLAYYPKAVIAVPYTPVPGSRLLAQDASARQALLQAAQAEVAQQAGSSLHLLFGDTPDQEAAKHTRGLMRHGVQFHWHNRPGAYPDFEAFLADLSQDKRKKIRQERRKVAQAGVSFRWARGTQITSTDWDFFYRCYERTYLEHGNAPYLNRDFFQRLAQDLPEPWLLFIAERQGQPIAASLIAVDTVGHETVAWGRYWGALERVDCLHFEACYYQPLQWCIEQGVQRFEGGAQGEHKLARALLPQGTYSAHWLRHSGFSEAVARFLAREQAGVDSYMQALQAHTPFRHPEAQA